MFKREIIYPIFLNCCQFTNDPFWQNIFEELAYGKTSYGIYISKNFICCNQKRKEFSYKIENKEVKRLLRVFILVSGSSANRHQARARPYNA